MILLRKPYYVLPLTLGLISLMLFVPGIGIMDRTRAWTPTLLVAVPALLLALTSLIMGVAILHRKPQGSVYGMAMTGSLCGGFSIVFWMVMVPMLLIFALPARDADSTEPLVDQSKEQMKILVRHVKTFARDEGRLPVKLEELVEKGYTQESLLYDPRQMRKDALSYRLIIRQIPPESEWSTLPVLEGRIPNRRDGSRLVVYWDESIWVVSP